MRAAAGVAIAFGVMACDAESQVAPRVPVNADLQDPVCMRAPAIEDRFPETFARYQDAAAYHAEHPRSIDLGAIGDAPLGREPPTPRRVPYWEQPFPCDWTNTCRSAPLIVPVLAPDSAEPPYLP